MRPFLPLALVFALACNGDKPAAKDAEDTDTEDLVVDVEAAPVSARFRASEAFCELDGDCAPGLWCMERRCVQTCETTDDCDAGACTARGQCVVPSAPFAPAAITGSQGAITVLRDTLPLAPLYVSDGEDSVQLYFETSEALPGRGMRYYIVRTDVLTGEPPKVKRLTGGPKHVLEIPTGAAQPRATTSPPIDGEVVVVQLVTEAGTFKVQLVPTARSTGRYAGAVSMQGFGSSTLPLDFDLVTDPPHLGLDELPNVGGTAWLVLPITNAHPFSPTTANHTTEPRWLPLSYDSFTGRWVATHEAPFDLSDSPLLGWASQLPVTRGLRFELETVEPGVVTGTVTDSWTGLVDTWSESDRIPGEILLHGTLDARRIGPPTALTPPVSTPLTLPAPAVLPAPDVAGLCAGIDIDVDVSCLLTPSTFAGGTDGERSTCALTFLASLLQGDTVSQTLVRYVSGAVPAGDPTFEEFLQGCADNDDTCMPPAGLSCARAMVTATTMSAGAGHPDFDLLSAASIDAMREQSLGPLLGAYHADANTRLTWLQATDYPALVTSRMQDHLGDLLNAWQADVVDAHVDVLAHSFDEAGLPTLAVPLPVGASADQIDGRYQLLMEVTEAWRSTMDSMTLAAQRWDGLLRVGSERRDKAAEISGLAFDLYLTSGVVSNVARADGLGQINAAFGAGFGSLLNELARLERPYAELVNERQAEVVVSRSLDPTQGNDQLLGDLEQVALDELESADNAVSDVLDAVLDQLLNEDYLRDALGEDLLKLRSELAQMCGLPIGCSLGEWATDPDCSVIPEPGACGAAIDPETGELAFEVDGAGNVLYPNAPPSDGSAAVLEFAAAVQAALDAEDALAEHSALMQSTADDIDAFGLAVADWRDARTQLYDDLERQAQEYFDGATGDLALLGTELGEVYTARRTSLAADAVQLETWRDDRYAAVEVLTGVQTSSLTAQNVAEGLQIAAEYSRLVGDATAEGLPTSTGAFGADVTSNGRAAIMLGAYGVAFGIDTAAYVTQTAADQYLGNAEGAYALEEADLEDIALVQELSLEQARVDADEFSERIQLAAIEGRLDRDRAEDLMRLLELEVAHAEAHARDLDQINQRQLNYDALMVDNLLMQAAVNQAFLTVQQKVFAYQQIVQSAQLLHGRYLALEGRIDDFDLVAGGPSAVFAWANDLTLAETRLQRAKDRMLDWVVALEYAAVRPFMDQRNRLLLSRNTTQLDAIAAELRQLQRNCGGPINHPTADLSLRQDVFKLYGTYADPVLGEEISAEQRFRRYLDAGLVPVDKRVRYGTDGAVGDLWGRDDVLAATFDVSLSDFANLEVTCNARIESIDIQLVGEDLDPGGVGTLRPTVSIVYDGSARLRSCQPDIADIAAVLGPEATVFNITTEFRPQGRVVSPVAGVGEFSGEPNGSLIGLPLASQYTVLIDKGLGANGAVNWDALDDVKLRIGYSYQDPFPSSCSP